MLRLPLLTGSLSIQFSDSPLPLHSQATYGYLPLTVQPLCNLRDTMLRHWSPGASHPGQNPDTPT